MCNRFGQRLKVLHPTSGQTYFTLGSHSHKEVPCSPGSQNLSTDDSSRKMVKLKRLAFQIPFSINFDRQL